MPAIINLRINVIRRYLTRKVLGARKRLVRMKRGGVKKTLIPNIFDFHALNARIVKAGLAPLECNHHTVVDSLSATRFMLAILIDSLVLRQRFPNALSAGYPGEFAQWMISELLPEHAKGWVEAAFAYDHRAQGDKVYEVHHSNLNLPLALTPSGASDYFEWYVTEGRYIEHAHPVSVLWSICERAESSDGGLVQSYLTLPRWQHSVPDALTHEGWSHLKRWVSHTYRIRERWLREAILREPLPCISPTEPGVNILGLFRYPSGLRHAANVCVDALNSAGIHTALRDIPITTTRDHCSREGFDSLERQPITILNCGFDIGMRNAYRMAGLHPQPGKYRIANWWWELAHIPHEWRTHDSEVDEIWAPTRFIAETFECLGKPVYLMPPAVEVPIVSRCPKSAFGLAEHKFAFLFIFDMNSTIARKNPIGLIRAFREAFRLSEPVELVLKVSPQDSAHGDWWRQLRAEARGADIVLIDRNLERADLLSLIYAADAYISLHRSEGFGLTLAEAMLLGKPTAATAYSGNLDFMTADNSYLIEHTLIPAQIDGLGLPPEAVWAEPSCENAALVMRSIYENPSLAQARAQLGQRDLRARFTLRAAGERMARRIEAIRRGIA